MIARNGRGIGALALVGLAAVGPFDLAGTAAIQLNTSMAQTAPTLADLRADMDLLLAAVEQSAMVWTINDPERRLSQLREAQAALHRLAEIYPAAASGGTSDPFGLGGQIAAALPNVDASVALLESNRETREARCRVVPRACALVAEAQTTLDQIPVGPLGSSSEIHEQIIGGLAAIAAAQAALGLTEDAAATFTVAVTIDKEEDDPFVLVEWIPPLYAVNGAEGVRAVVEEALNAVPQSEPFERVRVLLAIAAAQVEVGLAEDARRTYADALGVNGDYADRIAREQAAAGVFADALATARDHVAESGRGAVLADIAAAQAATGARADAEQTLAEAVAASGRLADEGQRAEALSRIANAQLVLGQEALARATVVEARAAGEGLSDLRTRFRVFGDIATVQAAAGLPEDAGRTLADLKPRAPDYDVTYDGVAALAWIAKLEADIGDLEQSRRTFAEALDIANRAADRRSMALTFVAVGQAEAGMFAEALATVELMRDEPFGLTAVLLSIARAQAAAGLFADAHGTVEQLIAESGEPSLASATALSEIASAQAAAAIASLTPAE